jgi:hypothetical protein
MVKVELGCLGDQFRHAEDFASHKSLESINPVVCLSASIIIMYSALVRSPLDFHGPTCPILPVVPADAQNCYQAADKFGARIVTCT